MKIVIPFDVDSFYTTEEYSLLSLLGLDLRGVIDQVLLYWEQYSYGRVEDAYELTMNSAYDYICAEFQDDPARLEKAEAVLKEYGDGLADLVQHMAMYLHQFLHDIPHELNQSRYEPTRDHQEGYAYMRVFEIHPRSKIIILTSDVT